ncbi:MAG: peptide chain release factor N(5)-glutamine methyltransferase [Candidatus Thiodiazotropha sp. (ex Gloverina cf. vestifex)]|nr:peptide chain release factor N(5)-glutamine methyltransferase [Candidatus Thiodiazotropha sp. (ex Gloverina cf. vestifex)]
MSPNPITLRLAQQAASEKLASLEHAAADLEAALLLCHLLDKPRSHLYAWPDNELSPAELAEYEALITRRLSGEPIAHITGLREFWSLTLNVTLDTLIPRPETELLVEMSLLHLETVEQPMIADLGTGSGAIAVALGSERPDARIHACDYSENALRVAQNNADQLNLSNIDFYAGNWYQALPASTLYDLIASNPPYIEEDDLHLMQGDLPREPVSALSSGSDGLMDIRQIIQQATNHLIPGGWLLLEHGYQQAEAVRQLLDLQGFINIETHKDLAAQPRVTEGQKPIS